MSVLPTAPRRLRAGFIATRLVGGVALVTAGIGALSFAWWLAPIAFLAGAVCLYSWRLARWGAETLVDGRLALGAGRFRLQVGPDGAPLALSDDERRRLEIHKLTNDLHSC